jgi:hypothetical protein
MSASFVPAALGTELNAARAETGKLTSAPLDDPTYAKGALISAALAPGLAPYISARVGIGAQFEAGATYSGRAARIDVRRSWNRDALSLSVGAGFSYIFYGNGGDANALPYVDLDSIHGYGADVPVLVGWQSGARLFMAWAGARAGWENATISALSSTPPAINTQVELTATRFYVGGLLGIAAGFRHVHVALELDASYQTVSGTYISAPVTVSGLTLAPGAALWVDF